MQIRQTHTYAAAPDAVIAVLTNPDTVKAKYEALGHRDVEILERTEEAGAISVRSHRLVPLDVPSFAKKVLPATNSVIQVDSWGAPDAAGVRSGHFTVEAKGVPVKVGGKLHLAPGSDGGSVNEIDATIECKIPFIGGKIADFVGGDARKAITHEEVFTKEVLGET